MTEPSQSVDFDVFHYIWFCVKLIQLVVESSAPIVFNLYSTKYCSKYSLKNKKCLFVCLSHAPRCGCGEVFLIEKAFGGCRNSCCLELLFSNIILTIDQRPQV